MSENLLNVFFRSISKVGEDPNGLKLFAKLVKVSIHTFIALVSSESLSSNLKI
jgi:hypothetical protein